MAFRDSLTLKDPPERNIPSGKPQQPCNVQQELCELGAMGEVTRAATQAAREACEDPLSRRRPYGRRPSLFYCRLQATKRKSRFDPATIVWKKVKRLGFGLDGCVWKVFFQRRAFCLESGRSLPSLSSSKSRPDYLSLSSRILPREACMR